MPPASSSSSEDEDFSRFQAVAVTSESLQQEATKSSEASKKRHLRALQRRMGGGGVMGAAPDSDTEARQTDCAGLDAVQLKVADALQQRLARELELATPDHQQAQEAQPANHHRDPELTHQLDQWPAGRGQAEEGEGRPTSAKEFLLPAGYLEEGVRLFRKVPRGAPLLLERSSPRNGGVEAGKKRARGKGCSQERKGKAKNRREARRVGEERERSGAAVQQAHGKKGAVRSRHSSSSSSSSESSSDEDEDEAMLRCLQVAVDAETLQRAAQEAAAKARVEMVGVDDDDDGSTRVGKGSKKRRVKGAEGAPGKAPDGAHVSLKAMMEAGPASIPLPSAAAGAACVTAEVEARGRQVLDGADVADAAQASVLVSHQQVRERDGTAAKHGGKGAGEGSPDRREKGKKDGRKGRDKKRNKVKKKDKGVKKAVEQRRFKQDEQEHDGLRKKERNAKERREGGGVGHMEGDEGALLGVAQQDTTRRKKVKTKT